MKITVVPTKNSEYACLGEWVAQIVGLRQARTYGSNQAEAIGNLIMAFGKEQVLDLEFQEDEEGAESILCRYPQAYVQSIQS